VIKYILRKNSCSQNQKEALPLLDIKKFGRRIAALRRAAHLRQQDVADRCHVSVQAISKWERGINCPDVLTLDDLASVLGVEVKDLFDFDDGGR
jgi:transcriptional regulator with XRE-family HTH domain